MTNYVFFITHNMLIGHPDFIMREKTQTRHLRGSEVGMSRQVLVVFVSLPGDFQAAVRALNSQ